MIRMIWFKIMFFLKIFQSIAPAARDLLEYIAIFVYDDLVMAACIEILRKIVRMLKLKFEITTMKENDKRGENYPYRELIGSLMFLSTVRMPDIAFF